MAVVLVIGILLAGFSLIMIPKAQATFGTLTQSAQVNTNAGDTVVVLVNLNPQSDLTWYGSYDYSIFDSIQSNPSISFVNRLNYTSSGGDAIWTWEFIGIAQVSGLQTITVDMNEGAAWTIITGDLPPSTPENNPSLLNPNFNDCNLNSGCFTSYSTNYAPDISIIGIGTQGNPTITAPAGYTMIGTTKYNGWMSAALAYEVVTSPQNNTSPGSWLLSGLGCTQSPSNFCGESGVWFDDAIHLTNSTSSNTTSTTTTSSSTTTITTTPTVSATTIYSTVTVTTTVTQKPNCTILIVNGAVSGIC